MTDFADARHEEEEGSYVTRCPFCARSLLLAATYVKHTLPTCVEYRTMSPEKYIETLAARVQHRFPGEADGMGG